MGFIDAAFQAQPDEPTGLALGRLVATLQEDSPNNDQPHSVGGLVGLGDFIVGRQRRVVRSTFGTELNGLVDSVEQLVLLQINVHLIYIYIYIYCGTNQWPEEMIDLLERGGCIRNRVLLQMPEQSSMPWHQPMHVILRGALYSCIWFRSVICSPKA